MPQLYKHLTRIATLCKQLVYPESCSAKEILDLCLRTAIDELTQQGVEYERHQGAAFWRIHRGEKGVVYAGDKHQWLTINGMIFDPSAHFLIAHKMYGTGQPVDWNPPFVFIHALDCRDPRQYETGSVCYQPLTCAPLVAPIAVSVATSRPRLRDPRAAYLPRFTAPLTWGAA